MATCETRIGAARRSRGIIVGPKRPSSLFFWTVVTIAVACGAPAPTGPRPKPALSSDSRAQVRFRELSDTWHAASPERRLQLEQPLRSYLEEFPYDEPRRSAWIYLAWILVQKGSLLEAGEWIDKVKRGPPGSVADFAIVTEAALLLELDQPQRALEVLRPIRGKLIDPVERFLLTEQLVLAALGSDLHAESILYMVDWGAQAPVTERPWVREAIESHLHQMPRRHLERGLVELDRGREAGGESDATRRDQAEWLREAILRRLTALAVSERDPELARFVLEQGGTSRAEEPAAEELVRLATADEVEARIQGRTLGLVLATDLHERRARSSEAAVGIASALGLPRAATDRDLVRLVFAEDGGGPGGASAAFASLSAQGVALIVAGVDATTAGLHAFEAERTRIPTLLLHPHDVGQPAFSFTLGVSGAMQERLLADELRARGFAGLRVFGSDSEVCDEETGPPLGTRLRDWVRARVDGLVFLGTRNCAELLLTANRRANQKLPIGLGFDAAPALQRDTNSTLALGSGGFPFLDTNEVAAWIERHGHTPSWYEALGHDAAKLAEGVLLALPSGDLSNPDQVNAYHERVRAGLKGSPRQDLWTVRAVRFDANLVLERRIEFVGATPASPRDPFEQPRP